MIPEPLSSIACCLRLVAVMLSQHLRGCRNPPPLMDQSLHAIDCMHRSTNRLIPDPSHSLIARISTMDQGSGRLSVYPGKLIPGLTATVQQYAPRTSVVRPGISSKAVGLVKPCYNPSVVSFIKFRNY